MYLHDWLVRWRGYISLFRRGVPLGVARSAGHGFSCGRGSFFRPGENIQIGKNVFMGLCVHIAAPCVIKDDVLLASYVAFVGGDHSFDHAGLLLNSSGRSEMPPIVVEEDVWIGHGVVVLTGVKIGRGAIIGAGSVVTQDVPPCTIWGGVPARRLRDRFDTESKTATHLAFLDSRYRFASDVM